MPLGSCQWEKGPFKLDRKTKVIYYQYGRDNLDSKFSAQGVY
jgi:hypothetical protein